MDNVGFKVESFLYIIQPRVSWDIGVIIPTINKKIYDPTLFQNHKYD